MVATEYLSARKGHTVISSDTLKDTSILVLHLVGGGRERNREKWKTNAVGHDTERRPFLLRTAPLAAVDGGRCFPL